MERRLATPGVGDFVSKCSQYISVQLRRYDTLTTSSYWHTDSSITRGLSKGEYLAEAALWPLQGLH